MLKDTRAIIYYGKTRLMFKTEDAAASFAKANGIEHLSIQPVSQAVAERIARALAKHPLAESHDDTRYEDHTNL